MIRHSGPVSCFSQPIQEAGTANEAALRRVQLCVAENWRRMRRDLRAADPDATGLVDPAQFRQVKKSSLNRRRILFFCSSCAPTPVRVFVGMHLCVIVFSLLAYPPETFRDQSPPCLADLSICHCFQVLRSYNMNLSEDEFEEIRAAHQRGVLGRVDYNDFFASALKGNPLVT